MTRSVVFYATKNESFITVFLLIHSRAIKAPSITKLPEIPTTQPENATLVSLLFRNTPVAEIDSDCDRSIVLETLTRFAADPQSRNLILAIRVSLKDQLVGLTKFVATFGKHSDGAVGEICQVARDTGYRVLDLTTALPSISNPRFLMRASDQSSQQLVLGAFLKPRRYALGLRERVILRVYVGLVALLGSPLCLSRGVLLRLEKC